MGCLESLTTPIIDFILGFCGLFTSCSDAFCDRGGVTIIVTIVVATRDIIFDWINFASWIYLREPYSSGYNGYIDVFGVAAGALTLVYIIELYYIYQLIRGNAEKDNIPMYVKIAMVFSIVFEDIPVYIGYFMLGTIGGCGLEAVEEMYSTLLRSQKILTLLVFWGLFRPQTLTYLLTINTQLI